jgi:hypothetical protein
VGVELLDGLRLEALDGRAEVDDIGLDILALGLEFLAFVEPLFDALDP